MATVKIYDGATMLGSATASGSGAWSFTTAALSFGVHNLTETATDVAGNTSAASSAFGGNAQHQRDRDRVASDRQAWPNGNQFFP